MDRITDDGADYIAGICRAIRQDGAGALEHAKESVLSGKIQEGGVEDLILTAAFASKDPKLRPKAVGALEEVLFSDVCASDGPSSEKIADALMTRYEKDWNVKGMLMLLGHRQPEAVVKCMVTIKKYVDVPAGATDVSALLSRIAALQTESSEPQVILHSDSVLSAACENGLMDDYKPVDRKKLYMLVIDRALGRMGLPEEGKI